MRWYNHRALWFLLAVTLDPAATVRADPSQECLPVWTRGQVVAWALDHNPELQTARFERGIAAAGVVIARTYPHNPIWDFKVQDTSGPESAGITNVVGTEHVVLLELELRHQGKYRNQGAEAALSRVEWDIANRELQTAIRAVRAFDAVLYRRAKVAILEDGVAFRTRVVERMRAQEPGKKDEKLGFLLAQVDVSDVHGQVIAGRVALTTAQSDLARALGAVHGLIEVAGTLEVVVPPADTAELIAAAIETRPDLRARQAALAEADAHWRLECANRFGNPSVGTDYEYDPTRISFVGAHVTMPLPFINTHRGEIQQREAERARAAQEVRQVEEHIAQDVEAAVQRLNAALAWEAEFRTHVLPEIQSDVAVAEKLAEKEKPGRDSAELIELRQRLLRARDLYLDAVWEVSQARADLAGAIGDISLATCVAPLP
jgi:cobalt-zinc-cadmium efflux system outer membrane protein